MASAAADRNLLCGMLAWQNGLITETQLLAALKEWTFRKSDSLEDVLAAQDVLSTSVCERLKQMVNLHVELNENNPGKSLERLSSISGLSNSLRQFSDSDLDASIDRTFVPSSGSGAPSEVPDIRPDVPGNQRFRIIRPHAKGGLGEVFVANDEELHREVALKEMQPHQASSMEGRHRFRLEAEITGGLEHPGIVPVYGLGSHADGRPFYAMRFIRGEDLKSAIRKYHDQRARGSDSVLVFRELLKRFVDVCNAIEYAHSRGVLHRDLKPGNIMLGKYGETLVVDWGLAKAAGHTEPDAPQASMGPLQPQSGSDITPTQDGGVIGTLQYMSPEQAAGRQDILGPATDVYAMGAILYEILTDQPPIERVTNQSGMVDLPSTLRRIQEGRIARPSVIIPDVHKPLEAICLKALRPDPSERYLSVADLADDIERWLADQPVSAWEEPYRVRAMRWVRQHRTAVVATAATVLVGLVSSVVGLVLLTEANGQLSRAQKNEQIAREDAEKSFHDARQAVNEFLTEVTENPRLLLKEPGTQLLRRQLLEKAKNYYQQFVASSIDDQTLQIEIADAHLRLAEIGRELTPGDPEVLENFRTARTFYDRAVSAAAPDFNVVRSQIQVRQGLANEYRDIADFEQALAIYAEVRELLSQQPKDGQHAEEVQTLSAAAEFHIGLVMAAQGKYEETIPCFLRSLELLNEPSDTEGTDHEPAAVIRAKAQMSLAKSHSLLGQTDEAMEANRLAQDVLQQLMDSSPQNHNYALDLASSYHNLAELYKTLGDAENTMLYFGRAIDIHRPLYFRNPDVADFAERFANLQTQYGKFLIQSNRLTEAETCLQESCEVYDHLIEQHADVLIYQEGRAKSYSEFGKLLGHQGETEKAAATFEEVEQRLLELLQEHKTPRISVALAVAHSGHAMIHYRAGDYDQTTECFNRAAVIYEQLAIDQPSVTDYSFNTASICNNLGSILSKQKKFPEAAEAFHRAIHAYESLLAKNESIAMVSLGLAGTLGNLAYANDVMGDREAAVQQYDRAIDLLHELLETDPEHQHARRYLRNSYWGRAELREQLSLFDEAIDDWDRVFEFDDRGHTMEFQVYRARTIALSGDHARAMQEAKLNFEDESIVADDWYGLACVASLALAALEQNESMEAAEREQLTAAYVSDAISHLKMAEQKNYFSDEERIESLDEDADLRSLRSHEEFTEWRKDVVPAETNQPGAEEVKV